MYVTILIIDHSFMKKETMLEWGLVNVARNGVLL